MTNFQCTQTEQQVHFLRSVAEASGEIPGSEIIERARFLGLTPFQPPYMAVIVYLDYSRLSYEEKDNTIQSVKGYISTQLRKQGYTAYCITDARNRVVCLFSLSQKSNIEAILNTDLLRLYKKLHQRFGTAGFIGAGNLVWKPENISTSYCEAVEMLAYKYQYTNSNVLFASQIVKFQYAPALTNTHTFDKVVEFFLNANLGQFATNLDKLIEEVRHTPNVSNTSIKRTMAELIIHILHIASNWFPDSDRVLALQLDYGARDHACNPGVDSVNYHTAAADAAKLSHNSGKPNCDTGKRVHRKKSKEIRVIPADNYGRAGNIPQLPQCNLLRGDRRRTLQLYCPTANGAGMSLSGGHRSKNVGNCGTDRTLFRKLLYSGFSKNLWHYAYGIS